MLCNVFTRHASIVLGGSPGTRTLISMIKSHALSPIELTIRSFLTLGRSMGLEPILPRATIWRSILFCYDRHARKSNNGIGYGD